MDGLYKVVEVDRASGILHLRAGGDKRFRVQLGPRALASFSMGMKVHLRKTDGGGLVLETTTPGKLAPHGSRDGAAGAKDRRRDRRGAQRVEFDGQATVTAGARTIKCSACDLSEQGIALRLPKYEQLEEQLELAFKLPNSHRLLRVAGVVARVGRGAADTVWGVGFRGVTGHTAAVLRNFVAASSEDARVPRPRSRMDRSLASLYEDAMAGLEDERSGN